MLKDFIFTIEDRADRLSIALQMSADPSEEICVRASSVVSDASNACKGCSVMIEVAL